MSLFQNRIFTHLVVLPMTFACLSLFTIPIHRKSPEQFTSTEKTLVTPDRTLHQLAIDRDYLSFAVYNGGYVLLYAIFHLVFSSFFDSIYQGEKNHKEKN